MQHGMTINEKGELVPKRINGGHSGGGAQSFVLDIMGFKLQALHLAALALAFYVWDVEGGK